jgi:hypothetical protein
MQALDVSEAATIASPSLKFAHFLALPNPLKVQFLLEMQILAADLANYIRRAQYFPNSPNPKQAARGQLGEFRVVFAAANTDDCLLTKGGNRFRDLVFLRGLHVDLLRLS